MVHFPIQTMKYMLKHYGLSVPSKLDILLKTPFCIQRANAVSQISEYAAHVLHDKYIETKCCSLCPPQLAEKGTDNKIREMDFSFSMKKMNRNVEVKQ